MSFQIPEKLQRSRGARVAAGACVLAVVFGAQLWLANLALPVDVDATDKFSQLPVKRSQHELLIEEPVFSFADGQLFEHDGAANEIVDVHFDGAALDPETAADLDLSQEPPAPPQSISYATPEIEQSPGAGDPCRTFLKIEVSNGRTPRALHFYQLEDGAGRSRHLEVKTDGAELVVRMSTQTPAGTTTETEGCRKTLRVGGEPALTLPGDSEVAVVAAPGSTFRLSFRPLDRDETLWEGGAEGFYAPFKLGPPQVRPNDPLPSLQAREVSVRKLQDDGAQTPPLLSARSGDGAPLLRVYDLRLGADELRVKVSGKAEVSVNGRAETFDALKRLEDRPILSTILGAIDLALLIWFIRLVLDRGETPAET